MNSQLNFHAIIVKFFQPLIKHRFLTFSASIIIGVSLYIGVDIGLAELARQNSYDMQMLASEMLNEYGPSFTEASKEHAELLGQYIEHMEIRQGSSTLRILYPKNSPKKALDSAREALEKATKEEEAKETIWQTGQATNTLYMLGKRFPRSPIEWFKSEDLPDELIRDLSDALSKSHNLAEKLEKAQTPESALEACQANRKSILLLFLARLGSDKKKIRGQIQEFLSDVKRVQEYTTTLAHKKENVENKEQILEWAKSEERRSKILKAMLTNDMDKVSELLREAVEKAYDRQKADLPP